MKKIIGLCGFVFGCAHTEYIPMGNDTLAVSQDSATTENLRKAALMCADTGYGGFYIVDGQKSANTFVDAPQKLHSTFYIQCKDPTAQVTNNVLRTWADADKSPIRHHK